MLLNNDEHIEYIGDTLKLIVSKAHTFGTDALLLASFAAPLKNSLACDFGTGCGIIPFYWLREGLCKQIYTFEIQEKGYNPVSQIVGYVMSGDPTYITSYRGARSLIMKVERDEILEELLKYYIEVHLK